MVDCGDVQVSIGSDAVFSAEELIANDNKLTGTSSIEQISYTYGKQAVVVRARRACLNACDWPLETRQIRGTTANTHVIVNRQLSALLMLVVLGTGT